MGTVPAGLADISDLCVIFICFAALIPPWGQSPQVSPRLCRSMRRLSGHSPPVFFSFRPYYTRIFPPEEYESWTCHGKVSPGTNVGPKRISEGAPFPFKMSSRTPDTSSASAKGFIWKRASVPGWQGTKPVLAKPTKPTSSGMRTPRWANAIRLIWMTASFFSTAS